MLTPNLSSTNDSSRLIEDRSNLSTNSSLSRPGEIFSPIRKFEKLSPDQLQEKLKSLNYLEDPFEKTAKAKPGYLENLQIDESPETLNISLYNFLCKFELEGLYTTLTQNGYDDLSFLIEETRSQPLEQETLQKLGVEKLGHRLIFLAHLEEESNKYFRQSCPISSDCCTDETFIDTPPLDQWLTSLCLQETYDLFLQSGFKDLKQMFFLMNTRYKITDDTLKEIGIWKVGHRQRILFKLKEDSGMYSKKDYTRDLASFNLACARCLVI